MFTAWSEIKYLATKELLPCHYQIWWQNCSREESRQRKAHKDAESAAKEAGTITKKQSSDDFCKNFPNFGIEIALSVLCCAAWKYLYERPAVHLSKLVENCQKRSWLSFCGEKPKNLWKLPSWENCKKVWFFGIEKSWKNIHHSKIEKTGCRFVEKNDRRRKKMWKVLSL